MTQFRLNTLSRHGSLFKIKLTLSPRSLATLGPCSARARGPLCVSGRSGSYRTSATPLTVPPNRPRSGFRALSCPALFRTDAGLIRKLFVKLVGAVEIVCELAVIPSPPPCAAAHDARRRDNPVNWRRLGPGGGFPHLPLSHLHLRHRPVHDRASRLPCETDRNAPPGAAAQCCRAVASCW